MFESPLIFSWKLGIPSISARTIPESLKLSVLSKSLINRYCFIETRILSISTMRFTNVDSPADSAELKRSCYQYRWNSGEMVAADAELQEIQLDSRIPATRNQQPAYS